jgi:hypothetical protein
VSKGSGLSRGDRNRNARLARLRELIPFHHAIVGIDLADDTQAAVVTDHDSRVIARRRVSVRARLAARRAVWAAMPDNPVMAARFGYLTTRQDNRLARQQARTACAATLLRWIQVVVTRHVAWDPAIAAGTAPAHRAG